MKGYSQLATAQAAAKRLTAAGYIVQIICRNGWYVVDVICTLRANDNTPPGGNVA